MPSIESPMASYVTPLPIAPLFIILPKSLMYFSLPAVILSAKILPPALIVILFTLGGVVV